MNFKRRQIAQFQQQDCKLTLKEALQEFYSINAHIFPIPAPDTQWAELLLNHDVGHVFFGINTSVLDETVGDYWTFFATDLSVKEYREYVASPNGKKLLKDIGFINIIKSFIVSLPLLVKVIIRARKMTNQWQTKNYLDYMDSPLGELRSRFNLKVLEY